MTNTYSNTPECQNGELDRVLVTLCEREKERERTKDKKDGPADLINRTKKLVLDTIIYIISFEFLLLTRCVSERK